VAVRSLVFADSGDDAPLLTAAQGLRQGGQGSRWFSAGGRWGSGSAGAWGLAAVLGKLRVIFLPEGYPDSVAQEYLQYQFWDTVQAMCSYLRGVLSTQALMKGMGVGDGEATPLAAALQWVLRDGAGMLGQLIFATIAAPYFGTHLKSWRLFADLINNAGLTLDLLAPLAGSEGFLFVASVAQVCKAMCGVAAGATKAALTAHFALRDNMADVQAKEGSQETFVTLLGLVFGMRFAAYANDSALTIWSAFFALTVLHCVANYLGVRCLRLPGLNPERMDLLIDAWSSAPASESALKTMSVASINAREPVLAPLLPALCWRRRRPGGVRLGARLAEAGIKTRGELRRLKRTDGAEPWRFAVCVAGGSAFALLGDGSDPQAQVLAYFEARALQRAVEAKGPGASAGVSVLGEGEAEVVAADAECFLRSLRAAGWQVERGVSGTGPWRYSEGRESGKTD